MRALLSSFGKLSPHFSKGFPRKNAKLISQTQATLNLIEKCSRSFSVSIAGDGSADRFIGHSLALTPGQPAGDGRNVDHFDRDTLSSARLSRCGSTSDILR